MGFGVCVYLLVACWFVCDLLVGCWFGYVDLCFWLLFCVNGGFVVFYGI